MVIITTAEMAFFVGVFATACCGGSFMLLASLLLLASLMFLLSLSIIIVNHVIADIPASIGVPAVTTVTTVDILLLQAIVLYCRWCSYCCKLSYTVVCKHSCCDCHQLLVLVMTGFYTTLYKKVSDFPVPGMSLTKLSLAGNN
jgi:hypothetical protein